MNQIPDNISHLYAQEEQLREQALAFVAANEDLQHHLDVAERAMDLLHFFITDKLGGTDDARAIQYLGIRVFNDLGAAWKLIASGYFQVAAMAQRDIVETVNLVQYFHGYPDQISVWRTGDEKAKRKAFSPVAVRTALDAKMGSGPSKRGAIYSKFSKLAAHPTIEGFGMLKPKGETNAAVGPFMDLGMLRALLEEQAKLALHSGITFNLFLHVDTLAARTMAHRMMIGMMDWMERYNGSSFSAEQRTRTDQLLDGN